MGGTPRIPTNNSTTPKHYPTYPIRPYPAYEDSEEEEAVMVVDTVHKTYAQTYNTQQPHLPPIDYLTPKMFPMSPVKYVVTAAPMVHAPPPPPLTTGTNLPSILHSSIGKLHMNFVQNKSLADGNNGKRKTVLPNGDVSHEENNEVANGVLKVAMYGEFPIANGNANVANGTISNGQKEISNGQKEITNEQPAIENGQKAITNGQKAIINGQKAITNGQRAITNETTALAKVD